MAKGKITIIEMPGDIFTGEYEPGNGTNYKTIAVKWDSAEIFNRLGGITPGGWLVINCNTQLSYLFQGKGMLMDRYIREKLGGNEDDYPHFGDLVRRFIRRE